MIRHLFIIPHLDARCEMRYQSKVLEACYIYGRKRKCYREVKKYLSNSNLFLDGYASLSLVEKYVSFRSCSSSSLLDIQ